MLCHRQSPSPQTTPLSPPSPPHLPSLPAPHHHLHHHHHHHTHPSTISTLPHDHRIHPRKPYIYPPTYSPHSSSPSLSSQSTPHLHPTSLDAVVQLLVWSVTPSSTLPWQMRSEAESRSTGFVVSGRRILTNAHCVEDASTIRVKKRSTDKRYVATVLHVADECDLALLEVPDPDFWAGLTPCVFGHFPVLQDTVFVVGYPMGGGNICITAGVVSRIDVHAYDHTKMTSRLLAIQIDAAVNDGNSGGPAFNTQGGVVGVAFETSRNSQNSGFIIPVNVVQHFLTDCERNGRYTGMCEVHFRWQKLANPGLKHYLGMHDHETGVLVNAVDKMATAADNLREGDVVCAIDGVAVSDSGTVPYLGGPVMFECMVKNKFAGDIVQLSIIRGKDRMTIEYPLQNGRDMHLVPVYECKPKPEYLIVAGLVFLTLNIPYLCDEFGRNWWEDAPKRLVHLASDGEKAHPRHQVVVLARILTADVNDGYQHFCDLPVKKFNGVDVKNLRHLAQLVRDCQDQCYVFTLSYNKIVAIDRQLAIDSTPSILERHSIPAASHFLTTSADETCR